MSVSVVEDKAIDYVVMGTKGATGAKEVLFGSNTVHVFKKVKCPVLALNGEKDIQVTSKENLNAIEKALKAGGSKDFTIMELTNLNHLFQTAKTGEISEYSKIEETMSPAAFQIIGDWILQQTESIRVR